MLGVEGFGVWLGWVLRKDGRRGGYWVADGRMKGVLGRCDG